MTRAMHNLNRPRPPVDAIFAFSSCCFRVDGHIAFSANFAQHDGGKLNVRPLNSHTVPLMLALLLP